MASQPGYSKISISSRESPISGLILKLSEQEILFFSVFEGGLKPQVHLRYASLPWVKGLLYSALLIPKVVVKDEARMRENDTAPVWARQP